MSFKSEIVNEEEGEKYNLCTFEIMTGGITPKAQPIDEFIGKFFKGHYRDRYDMYMLSAPLNQKGQPISPSFGFVQHGLWKHGMKYQKD